MYAKGPWRWGNDWTPEAFGDGENEYSGMKYADLQLYAADGHAVIPIRIDHHDVMIDHDGTPEGTIREDDRRLIAAAPELLEACLSVISMLAEAHDELRLAEKRNPCISKLLAAIEKATQP